MTFKESKVESCIFVGSHDNLNAFKETHPNDKIIFHFDKDKDVLGEIDRFEIELDTIAKGLSEEECEALNIVPDDASLDGLVWMIAAFIHCNCGYAFHYILPYKFDGKMKGFYREDYGDY